MEDTKNIRKYKKGECIVFRSTREEYGGLSNMAAGFPIVVNNTFVRTSEALYQALRYPNHPEIQRQIILIPSPIIAKRVAKKYASLTRPDWDNSRFAIMQFCIELKLVQNWNSFSKILLETNQLPIVEITKKDKIWGAVDTGEYYEGINALGRLLMALRTKIQDKDAYKIANPRIDNLTLLGIDLKQYASSFF